LYEESYNISRSSIQRFTRNRAINRCKIVAKSLQDLLKALKGLIVMSEQFETIATSLSNNKIPTNWQSKRYPSLKFLDM